MKQKELERQKKKSSLTAAVSVTSPGTLPSASPDATPSTTLTEATTAAPASIPATAPPAIEDVLEVSDDDTEIQADINNEDDLLIPLTNGWVCEKRRDITGEDRCPYHDPLAAVHGGYVTHYWSPEGDHFKSRQEIQQHVDR